MRKILLVIVTLFITAQVFAQGVTLEVADVGGGWAAIRYSADANVSAFGLKVTAASGAIFTEIKDYNVGECTASVQGYGIFPGTIDINELTGVVDDNGTPVAPDTASGAEGTGLDTNTLVLEMGALYVEGNEPALSGTLIKVKVDQGCNVCVEGEPIRGNIVMTDGTAVEANDCNFVQTDCFYVGFVDGCGNTVDQNDVNEWINQDRPACWCYCCHCRCDVDDDCLITSTDILAARNAWPGSPIYGTYNACADVDYDGVITSTDILAARNAWPGSPIYGPGCSGLACCE